MQDDNRLEFPPKNHKGRLQGYEHFENLFLGNHFDAFLIKIDSTTYGKEYGKLRYVVANFAGLVSKIIADMLFSEPIKIRVEDGDQDFIDALVHENRLNIQHYESALANSYYGDALFKLRIGKRQSTDEAPTVIIEDTAPTVYFPHLDPGNVRQKPEKEEIAWKFDHGSNKYVYQEVHTPGLIEYHVYLLNGDKIAAEVDPSTVGMTLPKSEKTLIDTNLLIHVPNWKTGNRFFGLSDYIDLETLFYAINNRITKVDNILDKHSDPILAVPEGILDEQGQVKREALNMIEVPDGDKNAKPEYIVWNANLDAAFNEIDKLIETLFMISETSPDLLGMGKGTAESGRALKLKLLRTIAKASRKKLYYDQAIKEVIFTAQKLAKAHRIKLNGKELQGEPIMPEIEWFDGLPIDQLEQVEIETKRVDAGLTTVKDSLQRIDNIDEEMAEQKADEISKEGSIDIVETKNTPDIDNPFDKE